MILIRNFIQQIIYIAIVAIIIELILPKGNIKKYVYMVLSLFIMLNIISPIINIIKDVDMQNIASNVLETISGNVDKSNNVNVEEFSEYKNKKIIDNIEEELSKGIKEKLEKDNITFNKLNVILNDDYTIKSLKISIGNLDKLGDKKTEKISYIISNISSQYSIDENVIAVVEEGI